MSELPPITDQELMRRAVEKARRRQTRAALEARIDKGELTPAAAADAALNLLPAGERAFVHEALRPGADLNEAAREAGLTASGQKVATKPSVARAMRATMKAAEEAAGVSLSKERLVDELDHAMTQARAAFDKPVMVSVDCKRCGSTSIVCDNCGTKIAKVEVQVGPKEVAQLAVAQARAVETTAKIIGALAPLEQKHTHSYQVSGSYSEVLRMVREYPTRFTPQQLVQIREAAQADAAEIDALLQVLDVPQAVTH